MKLMKVLVSGASIAGPTVAYWLARGGFEGTVVERAPAPSNPRSIFPLISEPGFGQVPTAPRH